MADNKYIDVEGALARIGGNEALYKKLLAKFEGSVDMDTFDEYLAAGDLEKAGEVAHTVKGVAGNLSLTAFFDQATKIMEQMRNNEKNDEDIAEFKALFEETKKAVNDYLA